MTLLHVLSGYCIKFHEVSGMEKHFTKRKTWRSCVKIWRIIYLLFCFCCISACAVAPATNAFSYDSLSANDKLLVLTYYVDLQRCSDLFYKDQYVANPHIAYYDTEIQKIWEKEGDLYITFITHPYLSAHYYIARDEITFRIDHMGMVNLHNFLHGKDIPLPRHLEHFYRRIAEK